MKRRFSGGFTVIEVLIAISVAAIGFAAIFSLQIASMQANMTARDLTGAIGLAERYVEVLRRDSYLWDGTQRPAPRLNQSFGDWHVLTPFPVDQNGRASAENDVDFGSEFLSRQRYCVHYWMNGFTNLYAGLLSIRVRVVWPRSALNTTGLDQMCTVDGARAFNLTSISSWFSLTLPALVRSTDPS
ncbi:MAG: prepilin-type N-terminal cleavage/methylation domain-containing protein [Myxococcota bacterium]|nr:prepilin-type N-terminal cleavage/methylation domain-containing protein [Myxococcota bacterium]